MNQCLKGVYYVGHHDVCDCSSIMWIILYEAMLFPCGDNCLMMIWWWHWWWWLVDCMDVNAWWCNGGFWWRYYM